MTQNLFTIFPRATNFFMNIRVASWLYSSYSNGVVMGTENYRPTKGWTTRLAE